MKTHAFAVAALLIAATSALPAAAQDEAQSAPETAELQARIDRLEARVAALEEGQSGGSGSEGLQKVALLVETALERLTDMIEAMKHQPQGEESD